MFQEIKSTVLDEVLSLLNTPLHNHAIELMESINQALDEFEELAEIIGE
jgi:hypothetical protein